MRIFQLNMAEKFDADDGDACSLPGIQYSASAATANTMSATQCSEENTFEGIKFFSIQLVPKEKIRHSYVAFMGSFEAPSLRILSEMLSSVNSTTLAFNLQKQTF